jgi:hypothetical protein
MLLCSAKIVADSRKYSGKIRFMRDYNLMAKFLTFMWSTKTVAAGPILPW